MIKSKEDSCVVSLNSRFILVLLLWLLSKGGVRRQRVNPFIDHLVILSSYWVGKVKCLIGLVASQQARLKGSMKMVTSRVPVYTLLALTARHGHFPLCCSLVVVHGLKDVIRCSKAHTREDNKKEKKKNENI